MIVRTGIGRKSHRFLPADASKMCVVGGVIYDGVPGLMSQSDGDVVYHSLCLAITSLTGIVVLGGLADELCLKDGITDSGVYVSRALPLLGGQKITHVAISLEAKKPLFQERIPEMREKIADQMNLTFDQVGITGTSGEGLTDVGCGDGIACTSIVTTCE